MKEVALNVFIPEELKNKVKIECINRGITIKEFVAMSLTIMINSDGGFDGEEINTERS